ncbi:hypothetical protein ACFZBM_26010 [Streptomyces lavendulae]|uniref:Uncharacterized protein n=1 Tax=Streptomyces lavendulae subsp. lavendulae TaxID=58340 RepID=A0A2K8PE02_STRLA|nr:hypothetical protein [Streptomyces lavendulae]ATZ23963.1 hypothetical protein SLAV_10475 [Streptomyces lavendulae subsp. lavendulae]QUQ53794.1 hypothetical protein SLLC_08505 [Streptomyces lavendulae subsp. lavendulae]
MPQKRVLALSLSLAAAVAVSGLGAPAAHAAPAAGCVYKPTILPLPAGATGGNATRSGAKDVFGGTVTIAGAADAHAAVWKDGTVTDLGTVPGANTAPNVNAVNSSGVVVGSAFNITGGDDGWPSGYLVPFRSRDGKLEALPLPGGVSGLAPTAISDAGDIYASTRSENPNLDTVYVWPADRPGTVIKAPGFPAGSKVKGVDSDGTVAVTVESDVDATWRPYTVKNGVAKALPLPVGAPNAQVTGISNGRAVGIGLTSRSSFGVVWDQDGTAKKLTGSIEAYGISPTGLIFGYGKSNTLWQLTTPKGTVPGDGYVNALTPDNALIGHAPVPGTPDSMYPAIWHCS